MVETPRLRAAIYARISQDRVGAGLGVDRQIETCRELAARLGWDVVAEHSDNDISAYAGKARPGYKALLDDIRTGRIDGVLAWHTDRLHRRPIELEGYIVACEARGVTTQTVKAGHLDLSTPSGRMIARQLGAVARYESEHKGENVRAARRQAADAGRWQGGGRPFGFEADGETICEAEAAEIVAATDLLLAGAGLRAIVHDWNTRGLRTTFRAREWHSRSVKDVLLRPRNAGLTVYQGEIVGPAVWAPIVPEDKWRALVALLRNPDRRTNYASPGVRWMGSGIYLCGVCERPKLRVTLGGRKIPVYRCSSREMVPGASGHVSRKAAPLDEYVQMLVIERLRRPDAAELMRPPADPRMDTGPLRTEAVALRERLDQLSEAFADGAITLSQLRAGTERLRGQLDEVEARIATAVQIDPLRGLVGAVDVADAWAQLDLQRKRAIVATLMTVTVLPSNRRRAIDGSRFNPESIKIEWLTG